MWFVTGFHVSFKLSLLLFGLLRALIRVLAVRVSAMRLRASVFFFSLSGSVLCKFPLDFAALLVFCGVLWISCVCCFCLFSLCLQSSFDCLGFHCGFYKFAVKFSVPSTGPLLGPKIVEIFCQVLEGPPECRKNKSFVHSTQYCCCRCLHVCSILRLPWLLTERN